MKRVLSLILVIVMLISLCVCPVMAADTITEGDAPMAEPINVSAYAAVLLDMDTGEVLYDHNAEDTNYPASTTKVMTAYLCLKYGDPKDTVTVSSDAFSDLSQLASTGGLEVGETMTVYRLLQALLVVSASEAANVVAEYISGSRQEFVDLMNEEAQALGCENTHFANCHGLPNSDHYTTAHDLAKIAMAAMEYETFREIVSSAVTVMEATNIHNEQRITSTNGILPGSYYPEYNYPYAIGIKTGHTSVAGYCLVSAADKDGQRLLCVVMGCGSRESSFAQTIKLYDWAYENYEVLHYQSEDAMDSPAEVIPDAPEYEEVPASLIEENPPFEDEPVLDTQPDTITTPAEVVTAASQTPDSVQETTEAIIDTQTHDGFSLDDLTGSMLPMLICFGAAFLILVILVVVLIVIMIQNSRRKKRR